MTNLRFLRNIWLSLFISSIISMSHSSYAQSVDGLVQKTIVHISLVTVHPETGVPKLTIGTGFLVTAKGHVLSAAHNFTDWLKQTDAARAENPIKGTIGDKPGFTTFPTLNLEMINPGNEFNDLALLKLPDPIETSYSLAPICFDDTQMPKVGNTLNAFGFPLGSNFQPVPLKVGVQGPRGRLNVAGALTHGMSGGPVYNDRGYVVAVVKGGIEGADAIRWVTPISFAHNILIPPFKETCPAAAQLPPSTKTCRLPAHGVESYQRSFDVTRESGWRGGGYDQNRWCGDVIGILRGEHPAAVFSVKSQGENSESKCPPFNCPQYNYTCTIEVKTDPLYKNQPDAACP